MTLTDLLPLAQAIQEPDADIADDFEITLWARCVILGLSHKCLRVLELPHFAGCLLNPGVGYIPNLNLYLPWNEDWFGNGIAKEDFRTTHACVKNETNRYRPVWLQPGETIYSVIIDFLGRRMHKKKQVKQQLKTSPIKLNRKRAEESVSDKSVRKTKFILFGPNLGVMNLAAGAELQVSPRAQAAASLSKYDRYHKGSSQGNPGGSVEASSVTLSNEDLKENYDSNPRIFWNDPNHRAEMGPDLVSFAIYIFSILSSSAGPEREFSRMGYLDTTRRSSYTSSNTNKRLTLANLIPQKRRLETLLCNRKIKKSKLFDSN